MVVENRGKDAKARAVDATKQNLTNGVRKRDAVEREWQGVEGTHVALYGSRKSGKGWYRSR